MSYKLLDKNSDGLHCGCDVHDGCPVSEEKAVYKLISYCFIQQGGKILWM